MSEARAEQAAPARPNLDDESLLERRGRRLGVPRVLTNVVATPMRLLRRRISFKLVASHMLVVLLTVLVVEVAVFAAIFNLLPNFIFGDQISLDYTMGEKARAVSFMIDPDAVERSSNDGTGAARDEVAAALRRVTGSGETPETGYVLPRVAHVLVTDASGAVVASSDDDWAPAGIDVDQIEPAEIAGVTRDVIDLGGQPKNTLNEETYVVDLVGDVTVAAAPIFAADGRVVGTVAVESVPFDIRLYGPTWEIVREILRQEWRTLWIVFVAGFVIAAPVGIWGAHTVSSRLSRLATAADAMAHGDLTRRVQLSGEDEISRVGDRFNEMAERLAATDRARKSFVANVSHELRTPIAIIQGNLERLLDRPSPAADGDGGAKARDAAESEALGVIHQEALTLSRLVDDLFTLTRLEETALPLELTRVRLDEEANQAVAGLRTLAWEQRKVTVQSLIRPDVPQVLVDRTRLRQIFNNLLYNSLRHTPEGGLIIVDATPGDRHVEVSVTDTGIGIPSEALDTLFDRYYRDGRRDGARKDGSGLGLHIVKQLVEAQGGTIVVESEPGRGTTFRFTLPQ